MNSLTVLAKSAKGIEEIETRAHKLGARLRQALIRVDGTKTVEELCDQAGEMGEALLAQLEELQRQGFVVAVSGAGATPAPAAPVDLGSTLPPPPAKPAAAPTPAAPATASAPAPAPPPQPTPIAAGSPIRFKLLDLLIDAVGMDTGKLGEALNRCNSREDLARWVSAVVKPIHERAGKAKARAFEKAARQLVGS